TLVAVSAQRLGNRDIDTGRDRGGGQVIRVEPAGIEHADDIDQEREAACRDDGDRVGQPQGVGEKAPRDRLHAAALSERRATRGDEMWASASSTSTATALVSM